VDEAALPSQAPDTSLKSLSRLIREISRQNQSALEDLYLQYHRGIFAAAYAITRDADASEDILQEALLYIWQHADAYTHDFNAKAWIFVIVRHLALDVVRKRKWEQPIEIVEDDGGVRGVSPFSGQTDTDSMLTLQMALDTLPSEEALVFSLKAVSGFSHHESARILGIPYYKVHYRYRRAIGKLREILRDAGPDGSDMRCGK
jgi:RNA polymerase sigma factor (sigma-70 family)